MSIRLPGVASHTHVRGTHVSTSMFAPSELHTRVLQSWGLPNSKNVVVVDGTTIYIRWDHRNPDLIHCWAHVDEAASGSADSRFENLMCGLQ